MILQLVHYEERLTIASGRIARWTIEQYIEHYDFHWNVNLLVILIHKIFLIPFIT